MAEGIVTWFNNNNNKGYGFIKKVEGHDIFVHFASISMSGFRNLEAGDQVSFDVEEGDRGPVAQNVHKI